MNKSLILLLIIALFSSCMNTRITGINYDEAEEIPVRHFIEVPHISQNDDYSCGTTSVAMAVSYHLGLFENPLDKEEVWQLSGNDKQTIYARGHDTSGYMRLMAHFGLKGEFVNRLGLDGLKYLIAHDLPVVLFHRPEADKPYTHAVLAVGYNDDQQLIYVEDPADRIKGFYYDDLLLKWNAWIANPIGKSTQAGFIVYPLPSARQEK